MYQHVVFPKSSIVHVLSHELVETPIAHALKLGMARHRRFCLLLVYIPTLKATEMHLFSRRSNFTKILLSFIYRYTSR